MSDPNTNPNPGGSRNMVWIIVAILVVVAVVWYVMQGDEAVPVVEEPATTSVPLDTAPVDTAPVDDAAPIDEAPADLAPADDAAPTDATGTTTN